jgi:hypothetical protein
MLSQLTSRPLEWTRQLIPRVPQGEASANASVPSDFSGSRFVSNFRKTGCENF